MFRMLFSVSVIIAGVFLSACSVLHTPQPVDYQALEQTAAVHITETFAAMPTATETFTPVPTNTPEPTATAIPTATEVTEELFISRPLEIPTEVPAEPTATAYFPDKADRHKLFCHFALHVPSTDKAEKLHTYQHDQ